MLEAAKLHIHSMVKDKAKGRLEHKIAGFLFFTVALIFLVFYYHFSQFYQFLQLCVPNIQIFNLMQDVQYLLWLLIFLVFASFFLSIMNFMRMQTKLNVSMKDEHIQNWLLTPPTTLQEKKLLEDIHNYIATNTWQKQVTILTDEDYYGNEYCVYIKFADGSKEKIDRKEIFKDIGEKRVEFYEIEEDLTFEYKKAQKLMLWRLI